MRLVALTAVAMMGTGCFVSTSDPSSGDVNLFWSFLRHAPAANQLGFVVYDESLGAVNAAGVCPESDVDTVRVESVAGPIDIACTGPIGGGLYSQGIVLTNLPAGNNSIRVTGFRNGTAVYRSTTTVNVLRNLTVDKTVSVEGVSAPLDLFADLFSNPTPVAYLDCAEANRPNITFQLRDSFGTLVEDGTVGCQGGLPAPVLVGDADLDNYTVRMQGFIPPSTAVALDSCRVPFDHFAGQTGAGGVVANLFTNPVPSCL
jgi:hypothetical protein